MTKVSLSFRMIAPIDMLKQEGSDNTKAFIKAIVGCESIPCQGSTGASAFDGCKEGSIDYYNVDDHLGYTLRYDYETIDDSWGLVRCYSLDRNETFDHAYDVDRDTLIQVLNESLESYYLDADTIKAIADKFAIKL